MRHDGGLVWSATTGELVATLDVPAPAQKPDRSNQIGLVHAVVFTRGGSLLAAVTGTKATGKIRLWDSESQALLWTDDDPRHEPLSLAFSPDGKNLASGGIDTAANERGEIRLWSVNALRE
ncbi:MAG: WD40 repeat domain-containing protein [Planctomycetota bacterium]